MKMKQCLLLLFVFLALAPPAWAQQQVTVTHSAVNVTTSSTEVVATVAIRRSLLVLINDSDAAIYCNLAGAAAVLNQGVRLNANGGALLLDVAVSRRTVNCIHGGSGNKVLLVSVGE